MDAERESEITARTYFPGNQVAALQKVVHIYIPKLHAMLAKRGDHLAEVSRFLYKEKHSHRHNTD